MNIPVILDVDTGIDDAMAIMFAVRHPGINLKAISCVSGNVGLDSVVENTLKVLDLLDAPTIPVARGADRPLVEKARDASYIHGAGGLGRVCLPPPQREPLGVHAVEMLHRVMMESEERVTLVALAPMTNIALLLRTYPECRQQIERILFMGGSASVGNATAVAEFNIWHDPEAAHIVLNSGIPLTMYGLDVFNKVGLDAEQISKLRAVESSVARVLHDLLTFHEPSSYSGDGKYVNLIGDAGAVCTLVASSELIQTKSYPVQVQLAAGYGRGQTIVDRRNYPGEDTIHGMADQWPAVDVVLEADISKMVDLFMGTLGGPDKSAFTSLPGISR